VAVLLPESSRRQLEALLGSAVRAVATVSGGDINDAYRISLADGRRLFVKTSRATPPDFYAREAEGLAYLRAGLGGSAAGWSKAGACSLRVPEVVAQSSEVLVLEYLEASAVTPRIEEDLGRGLAQLHLASPGRLGLEVDNYVGTLVQPNGSMSDWATFYGERRLLQQARLPEADRLLTKQLRRRLDRLVSRLGELLDNQEPPARLHGDLWGGNWLPTADGPFLVDPAVYGGHREVDLAMMALFGGFSERVFAAYREAAPLAPGFEERVPIHQLYPLLVHLNLFGAAYLGRVERTLGELA
jgi:fructosamine-3-kinase